MYLQIGLITMGMGDGKGIGWASQSKEVGVGAAENDSVDSV